MGFHVAMPVVVNEARMARLYNAKLTCNIVILLHKRE
jgi:hypothetical protein